MILGEDWLEEVSPIWMDYKHKVMKVTYQNKRITLRGVQEQNSPCSLVSTTKLKGFLKNGMVSHCISFQPCTDDIQDNAEICLLQPDDMECPPSNFRTLD